MDKTIKISVWGNEIPLTIVNDSLIQSLKKINVFDIANGHDIQQSDIIYWLGRNGPPVKKYFLFWIKKNGTKIFKNTRIGKQKVNRVFG